MSDAIRGNARDSKRRSQSIHIDHVIELHRTFKRRAADLKNGKWALNDSQAKAYRAAKAQAILECAVMLNLKLIGNKSR
jgi:hypothetical protein